MTALPTDRPPGSGAARRAVGMVAPYDFALDRELWRWAPDEVDLLLTRTPFEPLPVSVAQAQRLSDAEVIGAATRSLTATDPAVVGYACTAGSFAGGCAGERALCDAMTAAGAPAAVTTSGAVVLALRALGADRVAVATPYDEDVTALLAAFLAESGVTVTSTSCLGLDREIWRVPADTTVELVRRAWHASCDAVFVSCTNLATFDVIAPMEAELGVPVVSANQATMWAAVALAGMAARGPDQRLLAEELP